MTTVQQLVVSVFRDRSEAEQAINELLQAGFDNHQIRFAERGAAAGGLLEKIKSVFTGQDISAGGIYDDLVQMGAPAEDARYYQDEFEAGRSIVAVLGTTGLQEAISILAGHGGYGANQRFAQGREAGAQEPSSEEAAEYNRQQQANGANQSFARSADYGREAGAQEPSSEEAAEYNRQQQAESANQSFARSADYGREAGAQEPSSEEAAEYNRQQQANGANQRFAQSADYGRDAGAQAPSSEEAAEYNRQRLQQQGVRTPQETQQTASSNVYYDLVSVLYHALQTEQTNATYVQNAQESGDQDLVRFFSEVQQNASREAERAKQLLGRASAS